MRYTRTEEAAGAEFSMRGATPFFIFPTACCYREGTPEAQNKYGAVQFNTEVRSRFARKPDMCARARALARSLDAVRVR